MEKFITHTGIAVPLKRSNVDTDQIIPAVFLKRVTKTGFEDALFAAWRQDPEFVLNQPAYQGAQHPRRRPRLRHRLEPRARRVGAARLRLPRRAEPAVRRHLPRQLGQAGPARRRQSPRRTSSASGRRSRPSPGIADDRRPGCANGDRRRPRVPFEIDDYTRWRLLEGLDDIGLTLRDEEQIARVRGSPRELAAADSPGPEARSSHQGARQQSGEVCGFSEVTRGGRPEAAGSAWDCTGDTHRDPRRQAAARAASRSRARRTSSPRRWSPRCSARRPSVLRDVPDISDVQVVTRPARGARRDASPRAPRRASCILDPTDVETAHFAEIDAHAGSSRIPILFCGPLLHRLGEALIPDLGGCRIGDRPIDFHLDALRAFGAVVDKRYEGIRITAPERPARRQHRAAVPERRRDRAGAAHRRARRGRHRAARTRRSSPRSWTSSRSCRRWARSSRSRPTASSSSRASTSSSGYTHRALFDRNEAASWASAALATDGDIFVGGAKQHEMMTFLNVFRKVGGEFDDRTTTASASATPAAS